MKKLLLTLGLAALTLASAHAQGTINPLNGSLTRVRMNDGSNIPEGTRIGVFWGPAGSTEESLTLAGEMTSGTTAGIMVGLPTIFSVPGWGDAGTIISLQFRVTNRTIYGYGETEVKQVRLAPASGPGTVVWSTTGATVNGSETFRPLVLIPEPSTLALGGLACGLLLLRARRTFVRR